MHLGYMRVSKADGSQALDLQRDALLAAGVRPHHLYGVHTTFLQKLSLTYYTHNRRQRP